MLNDVVTVVHGDDQRVTEQDFHRYLSNNKGTDYRAFALPKAFVL
jgi:hypothetical protein